VDIIVISLWLGHESPATTHMYIEADLAMKERALKSLDARDVLRYIVTFVMLVRGQCCGSPA
jgi:integrase